MKKLINKKKKNNKGFSLVELVIVVAIMAILVGILAPQYIKYVERSRKSTDASNADNFGTAVKVANADGKDFKIPTDTYTITINNTGTQVKAAITANDASLKPALDEFIGGSWASTKLKSSKWAGNRIEVVCNVAANGSVTVTYSPTSVTDFLE